jgi:manganese/zinc/iron transport system substrate-binding protein
MKKILIISLFILTILSIGLFFFYPLVQQNDDCRLRIVCTTTMVADAVRALCGNDVQIISLMGPGVDPHLYRPKEGDIHRLMNADVVVYQGLHLEGKMSEALESMRSYTYVIKATKAIDKSLLLDSEFEKLYDPHIWHDVTLWKEVISYLAQQLSLVDLRYQSIYQENKEIYLQKLTNLDQEIRSMVNCIDENDRVLVTAHDAFAYYGRAYGVEVRGLQGLSTESDIGIKDVQNMANYIVNNRIRAIFLETSIAPKSIYALEQAVAHYGWQTVIGPVLYSDALGAIDDVSGTYIGMMRYNTYTIVQTLRSTQ